MKIFGIAISLVCTIAFCNKAFTQSISLTAEENRVASIYAKLASHIRGDFDSISHYASMFEKEFTLLIQNNPATLNYGFRKLIDSAHCWITTSPDGNFRIYSWDTWTGGTMHFFKAIYQWKSNGKVYSKLPNWEEGDGGAYCSEIFALDIKQKPVYLAITNASFSTKDIVQSISAYTIEKDKLADTIKIFRTKSKRLNSIDVEFDFFSVVDRSERPVQVISYDDKLKTVFIAVVDEKGRVTNRNIKYQLNGNYLEFTGIETTKSK